jgi:hypothetical protein
MRIYIKRFRDRRDDGRVLDMTPEGEFRTDPPEWNAPIQDAPWATRVMRYALVVVVLGGVILVAALALWLALLMIPVVVGALALGYAAYRWRLYKESRDRRI